MGLILFDEVGYIIYVDGYYVSMILLYYFDYKLLIFEFITFWHSFRWTDVLRH